MIDWDKPIETLTGWPAKVISRDYKTHNETLCLIQIERPAGTSLMGWHRQDGSPFEGDYPIHNVKEKIKGWVLMRPDRDSMDGRYLANSCVYNSEAEANMAKDTWFSDDPGVKPVHLTWEE
jgi:hypothetical protein